MFIPYNTDAPIYHFPVATIGLIVVNVLAFFGTSNIDPEVLEGLILQFDTINPLQWLTNNFLHADVGHLLGNMFFLWGFGIVVEGKLGWPRFLAVYLIIGIIYSAIVQFSMLALGGTSGALGASAAIFGLIALAAVWAPRNDINCLLLLGMYTRPVQMPILAFAGIYLALQIVPLFFRGIHMSSEMLHLVGLAVGFPIGILMLKKGWVDCEGWDLFNVLQGTETTLISQQREAAVAAIREDAAPAAVSKPAKNKSTGKSTNKTKKRKTIVDDDFEPVAIDQGEVVAGSINAALQNGNVDVAMALYRKQVRTVTTWRAPDQVIANLINGLHQKKRWSESIPFMVELVQRLPVKTVGTRIKLAQIMLQIENRPRQALRLLEKLPTNLTDKQRQQALAIRGAATRDSEAGEVELFVEDW